MSQALRVASYRFRVTFRHQLGGYVNLVLIIGLIGGIAMASVAAGRRTQSSYPTFVASTNPSQLTMAVYTSSTGEAGPSLKSTIARLPGIKRVVTVDALPLVPLTSGGAPRLSTIATVIMLGSTDGMGLSEDRIAITSGRALDPHRADEVVMTATAASVYGVHVGQIVPLGLYTPAQQNEPGFGTSRVAPVVLVHARVVGTFDLNTQVLQDDVDQAYGFVFGTPALTSRLVKEFPRRLSPVLYGLQLDPGDRSISTIEHELIGVVPKGYTYELHVTSTVVSQVELALKPESVAIGAFGALAVLASLVIAAQAIARILRRNDDDRRVMRALGASPIESTLDSFVGIAIAVIAGAVLAGVVAVGLSPISPIGPVRPVYPNAGVAFDWTVLGSGIGLLVVVLVAVAVASAVVAAPHRLHPLRDPAGGRLVARAAHVAGLPVSGFVGVHFALDPGRGRTTVPVRSVISGTVIAVALVVSTITFASGLSTLVSQPRLYGWNWTYALNPNNDVPPRALEALSHDPNVEAWSGAYYTDLEIDGEEVPILAEKPFASVAPPILSGHGLQDNRQIVLGAGTLALLHKHLGQSVVLSLGTAKDAPEYLPRTSLVIVGTTTLPAVGYSTFVSEHTSMGTGALVPFGLFPTGFGAGNPDPNLDGPALVFVRMHPGVSAKAGLADMNRIAGIANKVFAADKNAVGNDVGVLGVVRPVQIVNYRSIGSTPVLLAVGLALGAVLALGITLGSSVRRHRRDLALLKSLGFTRRQLTAAVAWQATVSAVVGVVLGIPIGIFSGRELWVLFARSINAVPDPTVPTVSVILVGAGTLVFANLVAMLPGRSAARTPTAAVLRAE